jgi:hypothetical protein
MNFSLEYYYSEWPFRAMSKLKLLKKKVKTSANTKEISFTKGKSQSYQKVSKV